MKYLKLCLFLFLIHISVAHAQPGTAGGNAYVKITTRLGEMVFRLSPATPKHTANFLKLARQGYFDIYDLNRVLKGFVAQGGETDSAYAAMEQAGKVLERIAPEFSTTLFHQKGALAAGRDDNREKASFLGQFYIVDGKMYTDSLLDAAEKRVGNGYRFPDAARKAYKEIGGVPHLDQNYTVFGQLVKGMEVFDKITAQKANRAGLPAERISIKVTVLSKKEAAVLR